MTLTICGIIVVFEVQVHSYLPEHHGTAYTGNGQRVRSTAPSIQRPFRDLPGTQPSTQRALCIPTAQITQENFDFNRERPPSGAIPAPPILFLVYKRGMCGGRHPLQ